jgi:uncharacterized OsmC-like protein
VTDWPQYPEHIGVSKVSTVAAEGMRVEGFFTGQPSLMFDEPDGFDIVGDPDKPDLRGRSRGWTPVHAQLAALSACTAITIAVVARDQGFAYSGLRTGMASFIDIRGFFFDLHLQPRFEQVTFDLWLDTAESVERIAALAAEADRRCPQLGLFHRAQVPMLVRWWREGDATAPVLEQRHAIAEGPTPEERLRLP